MAYPHLPGKHAFPSLHGPADFLDHALASGWDPEPLPVGVVFTFFGPLPRRLEAESDRFEEQRALAPSNARFFATVDDGPRIGVSCLSVGAPAMVTQVENLVHLGVRRFLIVGAAGAITDAVATGDCVLLTGALRDDGSRSTTSTRRSPMRCRIRGSRLRSAPRSPSRMSTFARA